jgi:hypothetical protein
MGHLAIYGNIPDGLRMEVKRLLLPCKGKPALVGRAKRGVKPQKSRRFVMKNKLFFGMIVCMALAIIFTGCPRAGLAGNIILNDELSSDDDNSSESNKTEPTVIVFQDEQVYEWGQLDAMPSDLQETNVTGTVVLYIYEVIYIDDEIYDGEQLKYYGNIGTVENGRLDISLPKRLSNDYLFYDSELGAYCGEAVIYIGDNADYKLYLTEPGSDDWYFYYVTKEEKKLGWDDNQNTVVEKSLKIGWNFTCKGSPSTLEGCYWQIVEKGGGFYWPSIE